MLLIGCHLKATAAAAALNDYSMQCSWDQMGNCMQQQNPAAPMASFLGFLSPPALPMGAQQTIRRFWQETGDEG